MSKRCDRCGRISEIKEVHREFSGKHDTNLCGRCLKGWENLWMKTYKVKTLVTNGNEKVRPIETEDLWKQFMRSFWEKVGFD